ncbi:hypothetical protein COP2_012882 [Malus domestica]
MHVRRPLIPSREVYFFLFSSLVIYNYSYTMRVSSKFFFFSHRRGQVSLEKQKSDEVPNYTPLKELPPLGHHYLIKSN